MKKVLRWVWSFLEIIIIIYVIFITSFVLCKNKYGYTQFGDYTFTNIGIQDERNIKDTKKGDLLIVRNSGDIKEGDLIYYYAVFDEDYIIKSNVVTKIEEDDYNALYTLDDSDGLAISSAKVLGKYSTTYNKLGGILDIVESRIGFLFLVLLPIMIVFIYQIYEFVVIIRYERDDDRNSDKKNNKKLDAETSAKEAEIEMISLKGEKESNKKVETKKTEEDIEIL